MKLTTALPAEHPLGKAMEDLKARAAQKSDGSIEILIYPGGQLHNDKTMNDALMKGSIDIAINTVWRWASVVPTMNIFDMPFLFEGYEKVDEAVDGSVGKILDDALRKKGVLALIWADYGFVQIANDRREIKKPSDLRGLKIRAYSRYFSETVQELGATSPTIHASEVHKTLQYRTIDGQTSGAHAMRDRRIYEVCGYLTVTNHASPEFVVVINENSYRKLSPEQRNALDAAAIEVRNEIRNRAKAEDIRAIGDLKAKSMEVYYIQKEEIAAWREATRPVWDTFIEENGETWKKLIELCIR